MRKVLVFVCLMFSASALVFSQTQIGGSGGTPGGSNTQVQFNNNGAFGADARLTYSTGHLTVGQLASLQGDITIITGGGSSVDINGSGAAGAANFTGPIQAPSYTTATNCSSSASPAVCASAASGSVVVAAAATTVVVNTTAVTANSQVLLTRDDSLGTKLTVTCNTATVVGTIRVSARTGGTSFTIAVDTTPATNPLCLSYTIVN